MFKVFHLYYAFHVILPALNVAPTHQPLAHLAPLLLSLIPPNAFQDVL